MTEQTNAESLRRKKQRQAKLSLSASALGLGGLGAIAGSAIVRRHPVKVTLKVPKFKKPDVSTPEKRAKLADDLKDKGYVAGAVSGGVGGIGGLNFAAIQRQESKKKVSKSIEGDRETRSKMTTAALLAGGGTVAAGHRVADKDILRGTKGLTKGRKAKKAAPKIAASRRGMLVTGGALAAAGLGNEAYRRKSGAAYKSYFDHAAQ
jgi:hypothetical protein